jgi:hypothetical protein
MRPDPRLSRTQSYSKLRRPFTRLWACRLIAREPATMTGNERTSMLGPVTDWFEVRGP